MNERKLLRSQTEDQLFDYICQDSVAIGSKLPNEYKLAELFGVGRSTVREAVKSLASKGILEVRHGSGTYVYSKNIAADDPLGLSGLEDKYKLAMELLDVRLMMEPEIAASAAENASEEDILYIRQLCDEVAELYLQGQNHIQKDIRFHQAIAHSSGNRVVELLVPIINSSVATFVNLTHRKLRDETIATHQAIVDAIARRDAVGARCAMIMHLTYNRMKIQELRNESHADSEVNG